MPYEIREHNGQWCIFVEDETAPVDGGCHESEDAANDHLAALNANVDEAHKDDVTVLPDESTFFIAEVPTKAITDNRYRLKATGEGRVGGYLVVWGNPQQRDLQGEYFTPETDLGLDWYEQRPVLYHHGLDGTMKANVIGVIDTLIPDEVGVWAEAQLDMRQKYVRAVNRLVERGVLGWSSGSLPHLVEIEKDGRIKRWPIVEGSLTPAPAEPRKTNVEVVEAAYKSLNLDTEKLQLNAGESGAADGVSESEESHATRETEDETAKAAVGMEAGETPNGTDNTAPEEERDMNEEMVAKLLAALEAAGVALSDEQKQTVLQRFMEEAVPEMTVASVEGVRSYMESDDENTDVPEALKAALAQMAAIARDVLNPAPRAGLVSAAKAAALDGGSRAGGGFAQANDNGNRGSISGVKSQRYAHLSWDDMAYMETFLLGITHRGGEQWQPSIEFRRAMAEKAIKAAREGRARFDEKGMKAFAFYADLSNTHAGMKANELDHSTQVNFGDEWVPDSWSSQIWERIRIDNVVAPDIDIVEMPTNPFEMPVEGADPTVYFVPETTQETELSLGSGNTIPDSKVGSGKVQFNAKKLGLRVGFSEELREDSIIPVISRYRTQAQRAMEDAIDFVLLNGDTEDGASGNINLVDSTPPSNSRYLVFDGFMKQALVTTTSQAIDASLGNPTLAMIRAARFSLLRAYTGRAEDMRLYAPPEAYAKLLNLPEFITMDKAGPNATAQTGQIGLLDGIPVKVTNEIALANTAGKVSNTGGNNLYGRINIVHVPSWYLGYRRKIRLVVDYLPYYDAYQMTATMRLSLVSFDNRNSAVIYGIAV